MVRDIFLAWLVVGWESFGCCVPKLAIIAGTLFAHVFFQLICEGCSSFRAIDCLLSPFILIESTAVVSSHGGIHQLGSSRRIAVSLSPFRLLRSKSVYQRRCPTEEI